MNIEARYARTDVVWEDRSSYFVIGGGKNGGFAVGNATLVDLLERFDGASSVSEIIDAVAGERRLPSRHVAATILDATRNLLGRGLIAPQGNSSRRTLFTPRKSSNVGRFSHLFVETTSRCNLRCKHCYMDAGPPRPNEMRLSTIVGLIQEFADLGGSFFTLSGGEPLMYRGWPILARYAADRNLGLSLMTNGAYLDQKAVGLIKKLNITVGLGLDGGRAETHDANRGKGSFEQTMTALELLRKNNHAAGTTICFTPMKFNVYDLPGIVEMMRGKGLPRLYVSLLEHRGRAAHYRDQVELTEDQREWLLHYLYQLSRESLGAMNVEVTHHTDIFARLLLDRDAPKDANLTIRVTSDGETYLSAYMGAPELMVGKVGEASLRSMLESETASEILAACDDRTDKIPKCRECVYKHVCKGGSAVLAYSKFTTFAEPDDYCRARITLFDRIAEEQATACGLK